MRSRVAIVVIIGSLLLLMAEPAVAGGPIPWGLPAIAAVPVVTTA